MICSDMKCVISFFSVDYHMLAFPNLVPPEIFWTAHMLCVIGYRFSSQQLLIELGT